MGHNEGQNTLTKQTSSSEGVMQSPPPHYLLQFFKWEHLPEPLQTVSKPFRQLALTIDHMPDTPEKTAALRKLLESKDCAVRAAIWQ